MSSSFEYSASYSETIFEPAIADDPPPFDILTVGIIVFILLVLSEIVLYKFFAKRLDVSTSTTATESTSLLQSTAAEIDQTRVSVQDNEVAPTGVFDPNDQSTSM